MCNCRLTFHGTSPNSDVASEEDDTPGKANGAVFMIVDLKNIDMC